MTNVSTAAVATAATAPTPAPSGATANVAITGLTTIITPTNGIAWAALHDGTAEDGYRYPFNGTAIPSLTPPTAGANYTIRIYAGPFTTPALATSATFTVAAAAGSSNTITFAGAAGAPTGNQVMVASPASYGSISGVGLDGSSNLRLQDAPGKVGIFQNFGIKSDGTMTVLFADGATNKAITLLARASATTAASVFFYIKHLGAQSELSYYDGASGTQVGSNLSFATPTSGYALTLAAGTITLKADSTTVATFTNVPNTATGYIGLGAGDVPSALIKSVSFT